MNHDADYRVDDDAPQGARSDGAIHKAHPVVIAHTDQEVQKHLAQLWAAYARRHVSKDKHGYVSKSELPQYGKKKPCKILTTIRLSSEVIDAFKAGGEGWQTRIDAVLCEVVRVKAAMEVKEKSNIR